MSEEGDYWRTIARKSEKMGFPVITITPENLDEDIPQEDMARVLFMFGAMIKSVSAKTGLNFILDVQEGYPRKAQCNMSPDGYHETMEVSYESTGKVSINSCIYCGEISRITKKNKEQIQKHFEKMHENIKSPY